jgi:hypothetical protein
MQAHIAQEVTTLSTLFKVSRRDGLILGFTDHDQDITYDGLVYDAETGYTRSAVKDSDKYAVDNLELVGRFDSDKITAEDVEAQLYDGAELEIYIVNWSDLTMGAIERRRGTLGQVKLKDETYTAEVRGLFFTFQTLLGEKASARCRSDLFDPDRCAVDPAAYRESNRVSATITNNRQFQYVGALAPGASTVFTLTNPGAELAAMTGWTQEGSANWSFYATHGGNSPRTGSWMFGGPASGDDCQMVQEIDFVGAGFTAADIDTGKYDLELSAWYNGAGGTRHTFHLGIRFKDENQAPMLGMEFIDEDGLAAPTATWTFGSWARPVPTGARYADIIIRAEDTQTAGQITIEVDDIAAEMGIMGETDFIQTDLYYKGGVLTWNTGANQRSAMEVKDLSTSTQEITLFLPMPFDITEHDQFYLLPGCDKVYTTCINKFNNINNFRGEPFVPGQDFLQTWPDAR